MSLIFVIYWHRLKAVIITHSPMNQSQDDQPDTFAWNYFEVIAQVSCSRLMDVHIFKLMLTVSICMFWLNRLYQHSYNHITMVTFVLAPCNYEATETPTLWSRAQKPPGWWMLYRVLATMKKIHVYWPLEENIIITVIKGFFFGFFSKPHLLIHQSTMPSKVTALNPKSKNGSWICVGTRRLSDNMWTNHSVILWLWANHSMTLYDVCCPCRQKGWESPKSAVWHATFYISASHVLSQIYSSDRLMKPVIEPIDPDHATGVRVKKNDFVLSMKHL